MKIVLLLLVGVGSLLSSHAQTRWIKPDQRAYVQWTGLAGLESRGLTFSRAQDYFQNDFLDDQEKAELLAAFPAGLALGFQSEWRLDYRVAHRFDLGAAQGLGLRKEEVQAGDWQIALFQKNLRNLSLDPDLLALALKGNAPYAGQSLRFPYSYYQEQFYTGIQYGSWRRFWQGNHYLGVSMLLGHNYADYRLKELELFTAANGSFLDLSGAYRLREAGGNPGQAIAGMGLALDYEGRWHKKGHFWRVSLTDLGFLHWTRSSSSTFNGSLRFEGIETNNIFDLKDSVYQAQEQSLRGTLYQEDRANLSVLTPFRVEGAYTYQWSRQGFYAISASMRYLYRLGYLPRLRLALPYRFNAAHDVSLDLSYGGFNAYAFGFSYLGRWRSDWQLQIRLSNLISFVNSSLPTGTQASLALVYRL